MEDFLPMKGFYGIENITSCSLICKPFSNITLSSTCTTRNLCRCTGLESDIALYNPSLSPITTKVALQAPLRSFNTFSIKSLSFVSSMLFFITIICYYVWTHKFDQSDKYKTISQIISFFCMLSTKTHDKQPLATQIRSIMEQEKKHLQLCAKLAKQNVVLQ